MTTLLCLAVSVDIGTCYPLKHLWWLSKRMSSHCFFPFTCCSPVVLMAPFISFSANRSCCWASCLSDQPLFFYWRSCANGFGYSVICWDKPRPCLLKCCFRLSGLKITISQQVYQLSIFPVFSTLIFFCLLKCCFRLKGLKITISQQVYQLSIFPVFSTLIYAPKKRKVVFLSGDCVRLETFCYKKFCFFDFFLFFEQTCDNSQVVPRDSASQVLLIYPIKKKLGIQWSVFYPVALASVLRKNLDTLGRLWLKVSPCECTARTI